MIGRESQLIGEDLLRRYIFFKLDPRNAEGGEHQSRRQTFQQCAEDGTMDSQN